MIYFLIFHFSAHSFPPFPPVSPAPAQACLDSVTGKRFQEAEAEAVKKWKEARQTAVAIFTGPAAAAAPATPQVQYCILRDR